VCREGGALIPKHPEELRERAIALSRSGVGNPAIARHLGVSRNAVRLWCRRAGIAVERPRYTAAETAYIAQHWGKIPSRSIAASLGRGVWSVRAKAFRMGVSGERPKKKTPDDWREVASQKLAEGWSLNELAAIFGVSRRHVGALLEKAGLAAVGNAHPRQRALTAARTRIQLEAAGLENVAQIRVAAFRDFATSLGWPADLRPRGVQIIELLLVHPLLNRRELCELTGMPWRGSRQSLASNDPEGSYLANLMTRGLVVRSPRIRTASEIGKRSGCGCGVHYYAASDAARAMKDLFIQSKGSGNDEQGDVTGGNQCDGPVARLANA
jgi:transposase